MLRSTSESTWKPERYVQRMMVSGVDIPHCTGKRLARWPSSYPFPICRCRECTIRYWTPFTTSRGNTCSKSGFRVSVLTVLRWKLVWSTYRRGKMKTRRQGQWDSNFKFWAPLWKIDIVSELFWKVIRNLRWSIARAQCKPIINWSFTSFASYGRSV